jgi:hypothetical protein
MKFFKRTLFFIFLLSLTIIGLAQSKISQQLIDKQTNIGIPYAYIKLVGKDQFAISDKNGYFEISCKLSDTLSITHVAYQSQIIPLSELKKKAIIKMTELPIELNAVVIGAKDAENVVKRAIDSTYAILEKTMVFKCLRKDDILFNDTLIARAKAELIMDLVMLFKPSHGCKVNCYLKNIIVNRCSNYSNYLIPKYSFPALYSPINMFIAGGSKMDDQLVNFSYQEAGDSLIIINFKPKASHKQNNRYIIKTGRFVINRHTYKLLRIDSYLSPDMMEYQRSYMEKKKDPTLFYFDYSLTQVFNEIGLPSRIHWQIRYSYQTNDEKKVWSSYSDLLFFKLDKRTNGLENLEKINPETSLINRESSYSSEYEKEFNELFF